MQLLGMAFDTRNMPLYKKQLHNHWQHLSQVIIITIIIIIIIIIITVLVHVIHDGKTRSEAFDKLCHNQ